MYALRFLLNSVDGERILKASRTNKQMRITHNRLHFNCTESLNKMEQ